MTLAILFAAGVTSNASALSSGDVAIVQLTRGIQNARPQVSDDLVVWTGDDLCVWKAGDAAPTYVEDGMNAFAPQVSGDRIVWSSVTSNRPPGPEDNQIFTWKVGDSFPTQVTDSEHLDQRPQISGDRVVWEGWDGADTEIFTWKVGDSTPTQLTDNDSVDGYPQISGDRVVWEGWDGADTEIFTWKVGDSTPTQLTDNDSEDGFPQISGDRVVWGSDGVDAGVIAYSGVSTWKAGDAAPMQLTSTANIARMSLVGPQVSDDRVVWIGVDGTHDEVFTWKAGDAVPTQVSDTDHRVDAPQVSGDRVVWAGEPDGEDPEIFTWRAGDPAPTQLTENDGWDKDPQVSGDRIVWVGGEYWDLESNIFTVRLDHTDYISLADYSRYGTALKTSQTAFADGEADCVVIATGANWPDALGGAALAAAKNGPILLTAPTALTSGITDEIDRLGASEAYILGGTGAVSQAVETALVAKMGAANVHRIWGTSRYQTAEAIAAATIAELEAGAGYDGTAFVATAGNFPDALAASPLAAAKGWPIFLCNPAGDPPTTIMESLGVTKALILGGTGAVSTTQEATLEGAFGAANVDRLWGTSRYATGVAVATYGVEHAGLGWNGLALSTGANFPDALAGGVLAARNNSVMLLTAPDALPTDVSATLTTERDSIAKVYYLGGTGAISQDVRDQVSSILQ